MHNTLKGGILISPAFSALVLPTCVCEGILSSWRPKTSWPPPNVDIDCCTEFPYTLCRQHCPSRLVCNKRALYGHLEGRFVTTTRGTSGGWQPSPGYLG